MIKQTKNIYSVVIFSLMLLLAQPVFADLIVPKKTYIPQAAIKAIPMTVIIVFIAFILIRVIKFSLKKKKSSE